MGPDQEPGAVGRPTDTELTARILDAAEQLLHDGGLGALRMEQVAKLAGCGKPAVYRRFPDKIALYAAVVLPKVEVGEQPDTGDLVADLVLHAQQNQRNQAGSDDTDRGFQDVFSHDVFARMWDAFFRYRREQGLAILRRGIARGELAADADLDIILDTIAGLTLYHGSIKRLAIDTGTYRAVAAALVANPPTLPIHDHNQKGSSDVHI